MSLKLPDNKTLVIPILGALGIKLSNTTVRENLTNENIQFKPLKLLIEKFEPDGILPFMDLTAVESEALSLEILFPEKDNTSVRKHPVKTLEDLKSIKKAYRGILSRMTVFLNEA